MSPYQHPSLWGFLTKLNPYSPDINLTGKLACNLEEDLKHFHVRTIFCICGRAQVPCKQVIEHAQTSTSSDAGVQALASVSLSHSESGAHKVFDEYGCNVDIKLSYMKLPTGEELPYIPTSDWLRYLMKTDTLEYLTGEPNKMKREALLLEFWSRYSELNGSHPVYQEALAGRLQLHEAIPVLHHGDEGRGFKRSGVLIISTHGLLGRGCHKGVKFNRPAPMSPDDPLCLNMIGHSLTRQYVYTVVPCVVYKDAVENFDHILDLYAQEMRSLFYDGISCGEQRIHLVCLNIKGDNVYLSKAGKMERAFTRMPRAASSQKAAAGVCWLCLGGKEDHAFPVPYEDLAPNAAWMKTCNEIVAWRVPGKLLQIPHARDQQGSFYSIDMFHAFHLGVGKQYISSALATLLQSDKIAGSSVPIKLVTLTNDLKTWCRKNHESPYIAGFTVDLLNLKSTRETPAGGWSKAHTTTVVMKWLQNYLARTFSDDADPMIQHIAA